MNQLRWNPTLGEWVAYTTHRQKRTFLPPAEYCPLCPTKPGGFPTEVPRESYEIAVFENKFPSFSSAAGEPEEPGTDLTPTASGRGVCEVVLYSDDHDATLATIGERRIRRLVDVWADRYKELDAARKHLAGSEIGAGAYVVDALPEETAAVLRDAVSKAGEPRPVH